MLLAGLLSGGTGEAQQIPIASAIPPVIVKQVQVDQNNRAAIVRVLKQKDVRDHARAMGVNLDRAERGLTTLSSGELATLAASARNIERGLARGGSVVVIPVTTLVLLLVLIILVVDCRAADLSATERELLSARDRCA